MAVKFDSLKVWKNYEEPMNLLHFTQPESLVIWCLLEMSATCDGILMNPTSTICSLQPVPTSISQNNLHFKNIPTTSGPRSTPIQWLHHSFLNKKHPRAGLVFVVSVTANSTLHYFLLSNSSCIRYHHCHHVF